MSASTHLPSVLITEELDTKARKEGCFVCRASVEEKPLGIYVFKMAVFGLCADCAALKTGQIPMQLGVLKPLGNGASHE